MSLSVNVSRTIEVMLLYHVHDRTFVEEMKIVSVHKPALTVNVLHQFVTAELTLSAQLLTTKLNVNVPKVSAETHTLRALNL